MPRRPFNRAIKSPRSSSDIVLEKRDLVQVHLCLGTPSPHQTHPDRYKAYLLNTIFGGGMSSRLFQEIREKRGLAYSIYSYLNLYLDVGSLVIYAGTSKEAFREVLDIILRELEGFRTTPPSPDELKTAKEQLKGGMLLGLESTENRMTKLAKDEIYFGRLIPLEEITAEIDRVTGADITSLAKQVFDVNSIGMVAMGRVSRGDIPKVLKNRG
ncbi:MAG: insulinase family protein, partial [Deltaproteobacteria bacterium]|nr:insulinase family protein [Deltaproteobacteria bacterium]